MCMEGPSRERKNAEKWLMNYSIRLGSFQLLAAVAFEFTAASATVAESWPRYERLLLNAKGKAPFSLPPRAYPTHGRICRGLSSEMLRLDGMMG